MKSSDNKHQSNLNDSLNRIAKASLWVLAGILLSKVLTYLYRIVIARAYGPEVYGLFSLAIIILSFVVTVSSLGLYDGLLRFIPFFRGKNQSNKISYLVKFTLSINLISGILLGIILFFSADYVSVNLFHNSALIYYLKVFSFLIPLSLFSSSLLCILRAYELIQENSLIQNILQNIVKFVLLLFFLMLAMGSRNSIILSYSLGVLAMLIASYLICRWKIKGIFRKSNLLRKEKKILRYDLFSYSWPILFMSVIGSLFYWIDSFSIGYFKNTLEVGIYNAATPIAALFAIAPEVFLQLFYPLINKEYGRKNMKLIAQLSKQVSKWIMLVNLPLLLLIAIFPGVLINFFFGASYLAAENALRILAFGAFFSSMVVICNNLLSMCGKTKIILLNTVILSVLNLILNAILVPRYGINGAALATSFCMALLLIIFIIQTRKYTGIIPFHRNFIKLLLISLTPLAFLIVSSIIFEQNLFSLFISGLISIILYLFLIYITKIIDDQDLSILKNLRDKFLSLGSKLFIKPIDD